LFLRQELYHGIPNIKKYKKLKNILKNMKNFQYKKKKPLKIIWNILELRNCGLKVLIPQ